MKKIKSFVCFDELFYTQKNDTYESDYLFEIAGNELKLNPVFDYRIAVFTRENRSHIFFTHIKNLEKFSLAYPEPLIFWSLSCENFIKQKNFSVMVFGEELSYICFFDVYGMITLKNLPKFNLKSLALRENKEEFFNEILGSSGRILELLKLHKSEIFLTFNDVFKWSEFFEKQKFCPHLKLELVLKEEGYKALQKLSHLSVKHLDEEANFIKGEVKKIKTLTWFFVLFLFSFLGTLGILFLKDYPRYMQNKTTQQNNENLRMDLSKLNEKFLNLDKNLKELNRTHKNNTLLLGQNEKILLDITTHFKPSKEESYRLWNIFSFLQQNALKISFLTLKNHKIKLIFNTEMDYKKALENLDNHPKFKILNSNAKRFEVDLDDE